MDGGQILPPMGQFADAMRLPRYSLYAAILADIVVSEVGEEKLPNESIDKAPATFPC
jgi:hypothetical protein